MTICRGSAHASHKAPLFQDSPPPSPCIVWCWLLVFVAWQQIHVDACLRKFYPSDRSNPHRPAGVLIVHCTWSATYYMF
ncbi:hypothetical protein DUNSADRAFT_3065 [Dunaliella salina]|uniref:Secreted protein n=1 Tax=Dunaliella salina TaxID=3046 RepID=A0ABQ7FVR3_DUNSA|nr:hypothetical protein DUNSADRAFT_3065 [Dunaliella salina]|eukprot:KAF5826447.1 hypothetical protein DUNSADRAFT_3065 [Dunaliella salina]